MKNIIVEVNGKFGNHLHQIMAGASIAKDYNLNFFINAPNDNWAYMNYIQTPLPCKDIRTVSYKHIGIQTEHKALEFDEEYTYITSYFLNYKWTLHNRDYLLNWLQFKPNYIEEAKRVLSTIGTNVCSIHVRRQDYLDLDYYYIPGPAYYEKALSECNYDNYLVCSDDIEWCKSYFPTLGHKFHFSENNEFIIDFLMMSMCSGNIIGNSSFSYWAAYFNQTPDKRVMYPNQWSNYFGNNGTATEELCLPDWQRIVY